MKKIMLSVAALSASLVNADFTLPKYEQYQLDNGLTVYLMEQHEVPLIAINVVNARGAAFDTQAGLASLTVDALLDGSANHGKQEIAQAFDFRGAEIYTYAGLDGSNIRALWAVKDHADLLPLFTEVILQPQFPSSEFDKLRDLREQELKQAKESPRQVVGQYFNRQMYGDSAYGKAVNGTLGSLKNLTRSDAAAFYQQHYCPQQTAVSVVGDFNASAMRAQIQAAFGAWKNQCVNAAPTVQRVVGDKAGVLLVNKPDARETTFLIGSYGIRQSDRDSVQLDVINTILGGRFTSWLNDELRVNSGLTYGARSGFDALKHDGTFAISSFTAQKNTEAALDLALQTYQRLWTHGIDAATLKSAKAYVKGLFPPRFETPSQLAGLLSNMYLYGYGRERIDDFSAAVDALTVEQCKALIAKHFKRDHLQMTLIGNADAIRAIAKKYGDVTEVDISAD